MAHMVLDVVESAAKGLIGKLTGQQFQDALTSCPVAQAMQHECRIGPAAYQKAKLARHVGTVVLIDCYVVHLAEAYPGFAKAIGDRMRGKARPMLDTPETLFFGRSYDVAAAYQGRGGVAVKRVKTENVQFEPVSRST